MALYSIRSERQFCERLQYDLLFKWFLGLTITDPAFDHSTFSKNRKRLLEHDLARALLGEVVRQARQRRLISEDHFSVDGTLLQAWASQKSVRRRDEQDPPGDGGAGRNPEVDFHGHQRTNATHVSTTDPEAMLAKKARGQEARLSYAGHILMENKNGLILDLLVTPATGTAEREAALVMLDRRRLPRKRVTLAADKGYDTRAFIEELRQREVTPHVAAGHLQAEERHRCAPYEWLCPQPAACASVSCECFGWMKTPIRRPEATVMSAEPGTSFARPSPPAPTTSSHAYQAPTLRPALPARYSSAPEPVRHLGWASPATIDYFLGVVQSRVHEVLALRLRVHNESSPSTPPPASRNGVLPWHPRLGGMRVTTKSLEAVAAALANDLR